MNVESEVSQSIEYNIPFILVYRNIYISRYTLLASSEEVNIFFILLMATFRFLQIPINYLSAMATRNA